MSPVANVVHPLMWLQSNPPTKTALPSAMHFAMPINFIADSAYQISAKAIFGSKHYLVATSPLTSVMGMRWPFTSTKQLTSASCTGVP